MNTIQTPAPTVEDSPGETDTNGTAKRDGGVGR